MSAIGPPNCSSFAVLFPAFSGSETELISGVLRLPKRKLSADEFCAAECVLIGLPRRVSQESSDKAKSERKIGRICALSKFSHLSVRQCPQPRLLPDAKPSGPRLPNVNLREVRIRVSLSLFVKIKCRRPRQRIPQREAAGRTKHTMSKRRLGKRGRDLWHC